MTDTVRGMGEWVEKRRKSLGLAPGAFAEAAGLSREGVRPVRLGVRKQYQDSVILGVAKALRVQPDWYERFLRGEEPVDAGDRVHQLRQERDVAVQAVARYSDLAEGAATEDERARAEELASAARIAVAHTEGALRAAELEAQRKKVASEADDEPWVAFQGVDPANVPDHIRRAVIELLEPYRRKPES